jgi:uncharacterized protein
MKNKDMTIYPQSRDLVVKESKNGFGLFTRHAFQVGDMIFQVQGKVYTWRQIDTVQSMTFRDNLFRFSENTCISPEGELGAFLNHSCMPNSKVVKTKNGLHIEAVRSMQKGEEVCIDYATILAADDIWKMACNCGEVNCRKVIKKYTSLPKNLQQLYKISGILPSYILKI